MKPEGGEIRYTDAYLNEENLQTTKGLYSLDKEGNLQGNLEIVTKGIQYDEHFGIQNLSVKDIEKYYKNYLRNINDLNLVKYAFEDNQDKVAFKESVSLSASKYASKTDDGKLIFIDLATGNQTDFLEHKSGITGLSINQQESLLATTSLDKSMKIFDLSNLDKTPIELKANGWIYDVGFTPDGQGVLYLVQQIIRLEKRQRAHKL